MNIPVNDENQWLKDADIWAQNGTAVGSTYILLFFSITWYFVRISRLRFPYLCTTFSFFFFFFQQISQQTLRRDLESPNRRSRDQRGGRFSIIEHESRHRIPSRTWTRVPDYLWTLDNYNSRQEINKSRARRTHPVSLFHSHSRPAGRTPLFCPSLYLFPFLSFSFCLCWCLFCRLKDLPADDLVDDAIGSSLTRSTLACWTRFLSRARVTRWKDHAPYYALIRVFKLLSRSSIERGKWSGHQDDASWGKTSRESSTS